MINLWENHCHQRKHSSPTRMYARIYKYYQNFVEGFSQSQHNSKLGTAGAWATGRLIQASQVLINLYGMISFSYQAELLITIGHDSRVV